MKSSEYVDKANAAGGYEQKSATPARPRVSQERPAATPRPAPSPTLVSTGSANDGDKK